MDLFILRKFSKFLYFLVQLDITYPISFTFQTYGIDLFVELFLSLAFMQVKIFLFSTVESYQLMDLLQWFISFTSACGLDLLVDLPLSLAFMQVKIYFFSTVGLIES